jgi:hypothetical protein
MPTALRMTSRLHVTPLLDIQHPPFEKLYRDGVYWSMFKDRCTSPLSDRYLLENVRASLRATNVDGQYAYWLPTIGFHFGRLHGAILSPQTGQLRPDMTTLACFVNKDAAHGYAVGRRWYFVDAMPDDVRIYTDTLLLERLQELEHNAVEFHDEESTWYYALGCILGELSGQIFPVTSQDSMLWEELDHQFWARAKASHRATNTEPLDPVPVGKYIV